MKRQHEWSVLLCLLTGCSTHPLLDIADYLKPGKLYPNEVQPYGGVLAQQQPITALDAGPLGLPPTVFPGGPQVPPAAPLPGNRSAPVFQLQPPLPGEIPPLPPNPPPTFGR